jgi:hypothetical protein
MDDESVNSSPPSVMKFHTVLDNAPTMNFEEGRNKTKRQRLSQSPLGKKKGKTVRFDRDPGTGKIIKWIIASNISQKDIKPLWFSRSEIRQMSREAHQILIDVNDGNNEYASETIRLFQECSRKESNIPKLISKLISSDESALLDPPRDDLRGLERQMHTMLSTFRTFHVRSLLKIQKKLNKLTKAEVHQRLLRSTSMNTSRVSRTWAIVLAHVDSMQVTKIIREELRLIESSSSR